MSRSIVIQTRSRVSVADPINPSGVIARLQIGGFVLLNDQVTIQTGAGWKVDGLLGYGSFSRAVVGIHWAARRMTITDPARFAPTSDYVPIPLKVQDDRSVVVDGTLDGLKGHFQIAIGQPEGIVLNAGFVFGKVTEVLSRAQFLDAIQSLKNDGDIPDEMSAFDLAAAVRAFEASGTVKDYKVAYRLPDKIEDHGDRIVYDQYPIFVAPDADSATMTFTFEETFVKGADGLLLKSFDLGDIRIDGSASFGQRF